MLQIDKREYFSAIGYEPHSAQDLFHSSRSRFRIACCGRRFGKSTMAARDTEPQLFVNEKRRFWIVGPTYDLGEKEFRVIWDDLIVKKGLGKDKRVKRSYNKRAGDMFIEFPWGTRIEVRSAQHPETLVGEALDGVIISEAAKHDVETWERYIRPSLTDRRGWATFPTTPEGFNWLYEIWRLGQNPAFPEYESWRFPSWENLVLYPGGRQDPEILLLERTTTADWFNQEIGAEFGSFVGKIYSEFEEEVHVRSVQYNPAWPNYIAFDFGYVNPLAAVEFQVDPQDRIHIWRLHYKSYLRLEEHLELLKKRDQPPGYKIDLCFGDPADPEAVNYITHHFAPCVADPNCKTNWRAGVDRVKSFLKKEQIGEDEFGRPIEEPRLFIDHSCGDLIYEFQNYRTRDTVNSASRESGTTSMAVKVSDHALDALRYALVMLFDIGVNHHLVEVEVSDWVSTSGGYFTQAVNF